MPAISGVSLFRSFLLSIPLLVLTGFSQAQAASVSYFLDQSNENGALPDGVNYLQVTLDDEGAPGLINFTVITLPALNSIQGSNFGIQTFGFNTVLDPNTIPDSALTNLPTGWGGNVIPPPNTIDGFGMFDLSVSDTGSNRLTTLTFSVNFAGDGINDYIDLSQGTAGEGNVFFAAHVAGFDAGGGITSAFFGGSTAVPLPAAVWLFTSGLLVFFGVIRNKNNQAPS